LAPLTRYPQKQGFQMVPGQKAGFNFGTGTSRCRHCLAFGNKSRLATGNIQYSRTNFSRLLAGPRLKRRQKIFKKQYSKKCIYFDYWILFIF
jgi:hypothetical protein